MLIYSLLLQYLIVTKPNPAYSIFSLLKRHAKEKEIERHPYTSMVFLVGWLFF